MATFRELFDEAERNELLVAMQARLNQLKSRWTKAMHRTERAPNQGTLDRLDAEIERAQRIIATIVDESN